MDMKIVTLDFETHWDSDYSLAKMTTEAYVRDPRFEIHGCSIRWPDGRYEWSRSPDKLAGLIDSCACLAHHAHFDGLILSHHYGLKPAVWLDTLSMARLVLGNHLSVGLDSLSHHYGLAGKTVPYDEFKGRRWAELSFPVQQSLIEGGRHDVELTWDIFLRLLPHVPPAELRLIDLTIRMFTEPALVGDLDLLGRIWVDEAQRKHTLMNGVGVTMKELQSSIKFAELLRAEGIEPPVKPGKNGLIFAFAKTDPFMQEEILEHPDERVRALGEARLGVRSTIDQTRAERLGYMATRGPLPVYLAYCGAHTTRWSGGDKVNWQNFKRGGVIRTAIRSPEGYRIIKADKSQIECRFLNQLAGQHDIIERFRSKEDPYIEIASKAYRTLVRKPKEGDPDYDLMTQMRGTGKQLELSCGYGAGALTIQGTAARGTYGPPVKIDIDTALEWRDLYRSTHPRVVSFWHQAENMLHALAQRTRATWSCFEFRDGAVILPNGTRLLYPELEFENDTWTYKTRFGYRRIWGGFLVENLIQAVSRVDIGECMLRIKDLGYRIVLMEHDAIAVLTDEKTAEHDLAVILEEMRRPPAWCPDIPLDAEGSIGECYA